MGSTTKTEILLNILPQETRAAVIENGLLQEVRIERDKKRGIVGNIYKGKVLRVLPGMQSAFIDIGLAKAGFLHVAEIMPHNRLDGDLDLNSPEADIKKWLHEGQEILIQVLKDPLGTKGARLTMHLSVASRYLVHIPTIEYIGISIRLDDEAERERLEGIMAAIQDTDTPKGYIFRTVAEGMTEAAVRTEVAFLHKVWNSMESDAKGAKVPSLIHGDLSLSKRVVRDMVNKDVTKVLIDSQVDFDRLKSFTDSFIPDVSAKLEYYDGDMCIFDRYGIEVELDRALHRKVMLKSGGYLVIDQTEAMISVDVNTGGFVGSSNLEETIFKTNLEAAQAIARQLRLRNLGGIIVIDFIDMHEADHKTKLLDALDAILARDYAKTKRSDISQFGLVEMTRKRTQESLRDQLCETCPRCERLGMVKSTETLSLEMVREVVRESKAYPEAVGFMMIASSHIIDYLMEEESTMLAELEAQLGRPIKLKADTEMNPDQFEIILL
jgi:ribonuclease G